MFLSVWLRVGLEYANSSGKQGEIEIAGRRVQFLPVSQRWVLVQLGRVGLHRRRQGRGDQEEDLGLHCGFGLLLVVVMVVLVAVVAVVAVVEIVDVDAEL